MSDGCGRLALRAIEKIAPCSSGPCRPGVAVCLRRGGCSRLDGHDPDQALRGFAAVRRADGQGALMQPVRRSSGRRDQTISIAISLPGPTQSSVVSLT